MANRKMLSLLFAATLLILASPAFGFGSASADCDLDGTNDITCTGSYCSSADEGTWVLGGYCKCYFYVNGELQEDVKYCSEQVITEASWLGEDVGGWPAWSTPVPKAALRDHEQEEEKAPAPEQDEV